MALWRVAQIVICFPCDSITPLILYKINGRLLWMNGCLVFGWCEVHIPTQRPSSMTFSLVSSVPPLKLQDGAPSLCEYSQPWIKSGVRRCQCGFLGAFAKCERRLLASSCLSVFPRETTRFPLDGFSLNVIFEYFSKICPEKSIFIKIWQE